MAAEIHAEDLITRCQLTGERIEAREVEADRMQEEDGAARAVDLVVNHD